MNESTHRRNTVGVGQIFLMCLAVVMLTAACVALWMFYRTDAVNAGAPGGDSYPAETAADQTPVPDQSGDGRGEQEQSGDVNASDDWRLTLVNADHKVPDGYTVNTRKLNNGLEVDERIYDALNQMLQDGEQQGLHFVICSAYRNEQYQQDLFDNKMQRLENDGATEEEAYDQAKTVVALPGYSEHQLGLAVDIVAASHQNLDSQAMFTPEYRWLAENCQKYGFVVRYPVDKSSITKIIYEPWHFRYVGVEAATYMMKKGICLEEYLGESEHVE